MRKAVIGLEIHVELKTKTKMFCDSLNDPDEKHSNINICPICLGHPGTLPVINKEAVNKVIMTGLALNCHIAEDTFFERKHYFYPDLPKGYQISQYQKPLCENGHLDIENKKIRITRIHLEEDAGRLYHPAGADYSLVDYNRAGVPLMELVTEPDFENGAEVRQFAEELQLIMRYLGVSDADMEKGQMRIEVNISLTKPNGEWGTKVEIKNLNSIKAAANSVDYEVTRQTELLEKGEEIKQETRGWDDTKGITISQRSKEEAQDYRYFPEPDLPPLHYDSDEVEAIKSRIPELPDQRRRRFSNQYTLPVSDVEIFTTDKELGNYFEDVASEILTFDKLKHLKMPPIGEQPKLFKLASNYLITELSRMAAAVFAGPKDTKITPEMFADLVVRVFHKEISSSAAQTVLKEMFETGKSPENIIKDKDLAQISDTVELESVVEKVIADNPKAVVDFKSGKTASLKFLVGMAMRESRGRANPQILEELIKSIIK
ncbi:MAG: Aspartyl/glutamyl-tRNA(Asn/Gln) amidotransferase subunit B [Candidatus Yanofskybacteria bacterium GW2011_GWA1_44_21]|uniref:Aspartyl/glutamyl-tRNA(Asn/Gln) amidotransferase subunit B n=2 Tax=Candidatus Yanofskyibacteriota TaxID=1752733 RepID=A0A1F8H0V6_9BACT|nr:MAG: Aspartyl/glutamyl-tRNA(Asn/Gln) amidotransferase subunit B [Candidatus Yanofskybacteria bacterium GW2011_GWA2_44_10]KKT50916.1 MAG: Aspartyl/glutamyl-tRNA(Asn/Gln) amidotransferase subunit B [Candidatus Yanofskybacteria bacterium GW2011_GWA1_44_21]KKT90488.1 MAG: Aspartyl/glutamyl-tRNA(Asn/Gln) amidotransferase subunit B [Candidatus Yanofskybacteria bacterium GW2011_GWB1_45_11]OGN02343.1 MAG: glutaminyl-tRNA synthase (glutamine-hydrolyzing) subunit B [Candidatus Yanofskybacteria bacteriu